MTVFHVQTAVVVTGLLAQPREFIAEEIVLYISGMLLP
jgi:hypothetical protein